MEQRSRRGSVAVPKTEGAFARMEFESTPAPPFLIDHGCNDDYARELEAVHHYRGKGG